MDPAVPLQGNRRGLRRAVWISLLAIPAAAWLLGTVWLSSPSGRDWIAAKIQGRTGMEARVGGASISPWNGVRLDQVELLQPAPLRPAVKEAFARIDSIRLIPVWSSWLRGRLELRAAELDSPRFVVPVELLAELARAQAPATPAAPPLAAATAPPVTPPETGPAAPVTPATPPPVAPETPPKAPAVSLPPTSWLRLKNASFTVVSASSGRKWIEISGLAASIPVAGSPAQSTLHLRSLHLAEQEIVSDLDATLDWKAPLLSLKPIETEIQGFKVHLAAKLAMLSGVPLQIEVQVPRQNPASLPLPADMHAKVEAVSANARFRGLLLAPGTWQGDFVAEAVSPSARIAGHEAKFERGSAVTVLRGGTLSCIDARLIGDELSFLGNATLLADGRAAAVLRMVAAPETAAAVASRAFPNIPQPVSLTPLSTPQRAAFDLEASGALGRIVLRFGKDGPEGLWTGRNGELAD